MVFNRCPGASLIRSCWVQAAVPSRRPDLPADRRAHLGLMASAMFEAQLAEATKQSRNYVVDQGK